MSKGSKRRPGVGYEDNWERIFNANSKTMDNRGVRREHAEDPRETQSDWSLDQENAEELPGSQRL